MRDTLRFPMRLALPMLAGAACAFLAPPALAQTVPDCSSLSHPVYVAGSTAVKPFLLAIAKNLATASPPITIVYQGQGSCVGVNYMTTSPAGTISGTVCANAGGARSAQAAPANMGSANLIGKRNVSLILISPSCGFAVSQLSEAQSEC